MQLDREAIGHYLLNISVENGGQIDWTVVNVTVLDANDNKPKFVSPPSAGNGTPSAAGPSNFFAVLPIETEPNGKFFKFNVLSFSLDSLFASSLSYTIFPN
jgi:hypothetical protein